MFIGFIFGALAVSNFPTGTGGTSGNLSNYDGDLEAFYVITGFGILLVFAGWGLHSVWPKFQARPRATPAPVAPVAAPAAMAPPAPPAAPAAPTCPKCGKPTTYIAQYGRYYCYTDNQYV